MAGRVACRKGVYQHSGLAIQRTRCLSDAEQTRDPGSAIIGITSAVDPLPTRDENVISSGQAWDSQRFCLANATCHPVFHQRNVAESRAVRPQIGLYVSDGDDWDRLMSRRKKMAESGQINRSNRSQFTLRSC